MSSRTFSCKYCGSVFNNRSNKYRHESKYCTQTHAHTSKKNAIPVLGQVNIHDDTKKRIEVKVKTKIKARAKPKSASKSKSKSKSKSTAEPDLGPECNTGQSASSQQEILDELYNLRQRVQKMENEPRYNNYIIIGPDMFTEMIDKYGREEALTFLTRSAITGDSVDVIKKLYLDGVSPEKYPIACKNYHHFRYLNDKREVIDDHGGQSVRKIFTDRAHKAMVLATNEMMQDELNTMNEDAGDLFRKLGDVQCQLASIHTLDIDRLAGMTNNPNHPFFLDNSEIEQEL